MLESIFARRIVLVTGKGGVGKTTIAAALSKAFARQGLRTLCAEVAPDAAAPPALAEVLGGKPAGEEPRRVAERIDSVLLTPTMGHRRFLQDTLHVKVLTDAAMRSSAVRKFFAAAPGFQDMGVMYRMLDLIRKTNVGGFEYQRVVVDSPATGHALALAQIPDLLLRVIPSGPIGRTAREGLELLTDPKRTGAVVVTLPETLPVTEARELCAGLSKHRVPLAAIVVNRVPRDPFTADERQNVERALSNSETVLGTRELRRIDRAHTALALLENDPPAAVTTIREHDLRGAILSDAIADELLA